MLKFGEARRAAKIRDKAGDETAPSNLRRVVLRRVYTNRDQESSPKVSPVNPDSTEANPANDSSDPSDKTVPRLWRKNCGKAGHRFGRCLKELG